MASDVGANASMLGSEPAAASEQGSVFERLCKLLEAAGVSYRITRHEPVYTSEQAAAVRGAPLASGAKALIVQLDRQAHMIVIPADRKLASKLVRKHFRVRSLRFASKDQIRQLTGLAPGAIPPFGSLFGIGTTCDPRLGQSEMINFNAGDHCISIALAYEDYLRVERPQLAEVAE